jgi:hypothetical protein
MGIPYTTYGHEPVRGMPVMSPEFREELHGRTMEYPLLLGDGKWVVVNLCMKSGNRSFPGRGETIDADRIAVIALAEARYFDFDK